MADVQHQDAAGELEQLKALRDAYALRSKEDSTLGQLVRHLDERILTLSSPEDLDKEMARRSADRRPASRGHVFRSITAFCEKLAPIICEFTKTAVSPLRQQIDELSARVTELERKDAQ